MYGYAEDERLNPNTCELILVKCSEFATFVQGTAFSWNCFGGVFIKLSIVIELFLFLEIAPILYTVLLSE